MNSQHSARQPCVIMQRPFESIGHASSALSVDKSTIKRWLRENRRGCYLLDKDTFEPIKKDSLPMANLPPKHKPANPSANVQTQIVALTKPKIAFVPNRKTPTGTK